MFDWVLNTPVRINTSGQLLLDVNYCAAFSSGGGEHETPKEKE